MNIRKRLTFLFIGIVAFILSISSIAIYFFSADYRYETFYDRLWSKAVNTAKLLIEVEEIDAELLAKIEQDNPTSLPNERITIYNYRNQILYSSDPEKLIPGTAELLNIIRLEKEVRFQHMGYQVLGMLYTDRYDRFVVIAAAKDTFGIKKLKNLKNILLVTFIVSIVLVFISGWIYSGRALKPISHVIDQVEKITEASLNVRVDEGNRYDEIARLAMTFNRMLDRLETAFGIQKNFIANASHELRTPLTAITGKIEVVLLQHRTPAEYEEALRELLRNVRSLNSLSNRLLLLAQASSDSSNKSYVPVRIDEILWQAKDDIVRTSSHAIINITFDLELDDDLLTVNGDEQLLKVAFANLMDNGCKYSPDHQVSVKIKAVNGELVISFSDQGIGIPSADIPHIFEPFYRSHSAMSVSGHGIGLSLVSKIITQHHGRIEVQSQPGEGTIFTVYLGYGVG